MSAGRTEMGDMSGAGASRSPTCGLQSPRLVCGLLSLLQNRVPDHLSALRIARGLRAGNPLSPR
jgi:hypothetical protein